ncbi:MAG: peptidylprolyl isomerase [Candidatus Aminicenantia bacterium]
MDLKKTRNLFFVILFVLSLFCSKKDQGVTQVSLVQFNQSSKENKIILQVEDSFYFNSDFEQYINNIIGDLIDNLSVESFSRLYDKFVDEMILLNAAKKKDISLSWEEKKAYLAKINTEVVNNKEKIVLTKTMLNRLLVEKYIYLLIKDIEVKEQEIRAYYRQHLNEFQQPERVRVSQILVETEAKAIEILNRLKKSPPEEFSKIAQEESISPEAATGGDMGYYEPGQLPEEMEKVIFALKEEGLSQVVESSYGFHIFRLEKREKSQLLPLDKAAKSIKIKLLQAKIKAIIDKHLADLKNEFNWVTSTYNLPFPYHKEKE